MGDFDSCSFCGGYPPDCECLSGTKQDTKNKTPKTDKTLSNEKILLQLKEEEQQLIEKLKIIQHKICLYKNQIKYD